MIVKFLASKKSKGAGATSYLLNKKRVEDGTAKILRGSRKITDTIIKNIPFSQKATMGVLNFQEVNIAKDTKKKLMDEFEKLIFPGMNKSQYNILWVEHSDKNHLELNFVIPKIELSTLKSFNPYYDRADRSRIDIWKKIQNNKYKFHNPDDEKNKQSFTQSKNKSFSELTTILEKNIMKNISENTIKSRQDIINYIKKNDIKVDTNNPKILKIKYEKSKKWIRLKGDIYCEKFRNIESIRTIIDESKSKIAEDEQRDRKAENEELEKRLLSYQNKKISKINKLYNSNSDNSNTSVQSFSTKNDTSISELLARAEQNRAEKERMEKAKRTRAKQNRAEQNRAEKERIRMAKRDRLLREQKLAKDKLIAEESKKREAKEREIQEKNNRVREEARAKWVEHRLKERKILNEHRAIRKQIQANVREHQARLRADITRTTEDTQETIGKYNDKYESALHRLGKKIQDTTRAIQTFAGKLLAKKQKEPPRPTMGFPSPGM